MLTQLNHKVQYILSILGIGCISALVFLFNRRADSLAFHCLTYVPVAFGEACIQAVTSESWHASSDTSMVIVVALPCIAYIIGCRETMTLSVRFVLTCLGIAFLSVYVFMLNSVHGNLA